MTAADYLMLISMVCIWALMAINVFLSVGGFPVLPSMQQNGRACAD